MPRPLLAAVALACLLVPQAALVAEVPPGQEPALKGIHIDKKAGHVDLAAEVVLREAEWLELLACSPNSREHESILTVVARPSDIHFALLLLGVEDGSPMTWEKNEEEEVTTTPPSGPKIEVTLTYEADGKTVTVPASKWIVDSQKGKNLDSSTWLFAGSRFETFKGEQYYMANREGNILSLVNFGDEVLARDTKITRDTDDRVWTTNTKAIPEVGTKVTMRLTPVADADAKK